MPQLNGAGMVELYNHPALWANRQLPRVHGTFADISSTEALWVTIDRANLNVPNRPGFTFEGLIRNSRLPHGTSPNTSHRPRLAQYISTSPAPEDNAAARAWRTESQLHRRAPEGDPFPGDPRGWERRHGTTAALTPLDRKLLGLDTWAPPRPRTPAAAAPCGWTTPSGRRRATPGFAS